MKGGTLMAKRGQSIYNELFDQLPIPERLEPRNIAAMLDEKMAQGAMNSKTADRVVPVGASAKQRKSDRETIDISAGRRTSAAYRSIASVAACAALVLGVVGYMRTDSAPVPDTDDKSGGAYASDYGDIHKTFAKYYVDDGDKRTLDGALQDIEHSYNDNENDTSNSAQAPAQTQETTEAAESSGTTESAQTDAPQTTERPGQAPTDTAPDADGQGGSETIDENNEPTVISDDLPIPENDAIVNNSDTAFGSGFMLRRDGNILRIITSVNGEINYTDNIFPSYDGFSTKSLAGFYADGNKAVAVYTVMTTAGSAPSSEESRDGVVGELLDSLYGPPITESGVKRSEVEVCVYDIVDGNAYLTNDTVQSGTLIDMNYSNGAVYLVTAYDDYRGDPIASVDDLENYVPAYTVNGEKFYVSASDIMLPDYISNTDYTVISGITVDGAVSVKAVLGYEGRVIVNNGAVYLFSYDSVNGTDLTSVRVFSLAGGNVIYAGFTDIEGVALGGDGISSIGDSIAVTVIKKSDGAYITSFGIYDATMNFISGADFPSALTAAERIGQKLVLSGAKYKCVVDLTNISIPVVSEGEPAKNPAEGLLQFNGGYVTLTKNSSGQIELSKLVKDESGNLKLMHKTVVTAESNSTSKALKNNGVMFINGDVVGLPYGYFDGLDYCYRYAIFKETAEGFVLVGETEIHETDEAFEYENAILNSGVLYIMSEGRVSAAVVGDSLAVISTADIIEGAHSAHAVN